MRRAFGPHVLCYHAVSSDWEHALAVPVEALEAQVAALLARGLRPAGAAEAAEGRGRLLHVTFDDAYASVERALPALERLGVPATVFACPGYADGGRPLTVPELAGEPVDELETMDWAALRGLAERGVEIGSHTSSHPHLPRLGDDELRRELVESRQRLEDELGRPCRWLAYPYGEQDERVRRAAEAAGYDAAFALPGDEERWERFAVPRVGVYRRDSALRFRLKTTPLVRRPGAALRRLRARS